MDASPDPASHGAAERKLITVLFCDLVGSTEMGERLDPEALRSIQGAYFDRMRSVIEGFGGTVEKFIGDAVVAVFGVPRVHEDDAERAVRCALAMREALGGLNDTLRPRFGVELTVRIGVNSGEAVVSGQQAQEALATGDVMNTAARLEQAAGPGEVLVGKETMHLSRSAVDFGEPRSVEAKGKAELLEAWVPEGLLESKRRVRSPLAGRARELETLSALVERAVAGDGPQVALILGEPGIGKTRLTEELALRTAGRVTLFRGTCLPYGESTTWLPLAEAIRADADILPGDDAHVVEAKILQRLGHRHQTEEASLIGAQIAPLAGGATSKVVSGQELLWALRRYLEALASASPAVLVLDDLHWGSETLVDTLQELIETMAPAPLVLVCLGRPEVKERMADVVAHPRTTVVALEALPESDARQLVSGLTGILGQEWHSDVEESIARQAAGNPLFAEEIAAMTAEEGSEATIPGSLRALVAARLDLLPPGAKRVAQAGAVVGEVFWDGAVSALLDGSADVGRTASALRLLRTRGLVEEERGSPFLGSRAFAFHHALVREVAYESLSKGHRSEMHRRAARWLEGNASERSELSVNIAHHLDRALSLAAEVAPLDAPEPALVRETAEALLRAGDWVMSMAAPPEGIGLFRRAVEVSAELPDITDLCRGRLAAALSLAAQIDEAVQVAEDVLGRAGSEEAHAFASFAMANAWYARGDPDQIRRYAKPAAELAGRVGPRALEAQALHLLGWPDFWDDDFPTADRTWRRAAEVAREAGHLGLAAEASASRALLGFFGLDAGAAAEAAGEAMRLARESGGIRALGSAHLAVARTLELQDRPEEAVEHGREYLRLSVQTGDRVEVITALIFGVAWPLFEMDRLEEAWSVLEEALATTIESGAPVYEPEIRFLRARVLLSQGRIGESERELDDVVGVPVADKWVRASRAAGMAEVRGAQGRHEEASRFWSEAIGSEASTKGDLLNPVEIRLRYGNFLADRGRVEEARSVVAGIRTMIYGRDAPSVERDLAALEGRLLGP